MIQSDVKKALIDLLGDGNYSDAMEDRICYAFDASRRKRLPDAVVFPHNALEISELIKIATEYRIPVVPRGAGSGMTGGSVPAEGGIVLDTVRLDRIIEIDADNLFAVVEPGVITSRLHEAVENQGLFYPPDPASRAFSTIGGNISENSGGMRAVKYGVTKDYVMGLEVVLPSGSIIHTGSMCAKDVVGYNITQLFVGSEGTLGVITKAVLKLLPLPKEKLTLAAVFSSMGKAVKAISGIIKAGVIPSTLEFLDKHTIRAVEDHLHLGLPETAEAFLLVEIDGDTGEVSGKIERIKEICNANHAVEVKIARDEKEQKELWEARRAVSASLLRIRTGKLNEDIVVPRSRIPDILKEIEKTGKTHGLIIPCFGHAGDGNIHVNVMYDRSKGEFERASQAVYDIFQKTVEMKGRISGEHGIGMTKKDYMTMNLDPATVKLMQDIKKAVDPLNILNPGKIFPK